MIRMLLLATTALATPGVTVAQPAAPRSPTPVQRSVAAADTAKPAVASSAISPRLGITAIRPSPTPDLAQDTVFIQRPSRRGAGALLLVGGAGLLVGLATDSDVLTVVGAGVAGVGVYLYFR